ncbi:MAG: ThuA domain-containing protein [Armatimonadota bacterium]|nr:ThuA domain-containing protein [bacterium]MDW8320819.1 ThuA domain-containing protein [Armatimonadota bacterium]
MNGTWWMLAICAVVVLLNVSTEAQRTGATSRAKKRLLVVSHTAGFRHEGAIKSFDKVIAELADKSGQFTVEYCRTAEDVKRMMSSEGLKQYDGVIFSNTTGNIGIPDLQAFLNWVKSGKAVIGLHAAADTYHDEPAFIEMIGGEFLTHGAQCEVEVIVEDPRHPAMAHLAPRFKVFDEIYEYKNNDRAKLHVLGSMDKHPNDGHPQAGQPGDYLLIWCKPYGKGRVFYTGLGHREDVIESDWYKQHILGGIRWALGIVRNPQPRVGQPAAK